MTLTRSAFLGAKAILIVAAVLVLAPQRSNAAVYTYDFSFVFSGSAPAGSGPWLQAKFEDVSPGAVKLTFTALNLTGAENVIKAFFNLNPLYDPELLNVTWDSGVGSFMQPTVLLGMNEFKADGDGFYDFRFDFTSDGIGDESRFTTGESGTWIITAPAIVPDLQASDFNYVSVMGGGAGVYYGAAHVQRIGGADSGWIGVPVPEPSSLSLLVVAGLFRLRRLIR